jgi:putative component of membrane protein insertase Oxa1/YidC/SpoIIIJ protein YidD
MLFKTLLIFFAEIGYVEPWGKDAPLPPPPAREERTYTPLAILARQAIALHQNHVTHISGPRSHFRPSSSQYMLEAIHSYGFTLGYLMGCDRLLRENGDPWLYRTKCYDGLHYKWDPPMAPK